MEGWKLTQVPPVEVRNYWNLIHDGLEQVRKRSYSNWIPEDIYAALRVGGASLYVGHMDGKYVGFFVIQHLTDGYTNKPELFIWVAYSNDLRALDLGLHDIEELAKAAKCVSISFRTSRPGWARKLEGNGFSVREMIISKELG